MGSKTVTVEVEVDVDEVISDLTDAELLEECESRGLDARDLDPDGAGPDSADLLERSYSELRQGQIGAATRDYMYLKLGRIL